MKIVIAGGSGHVGAALRRHFARAGHDVVVLSRSVNIPGAVVWGGRSLGPWTKEVDGSDVVINLAGRTVNCRYTQANLRQMRDSRVDSTRVVGEAIANCAAPPRVWLQASTATIYAHRFDAPNDEFNGVIGGEEPDAPPKWRASVQIAKEWENALEAAKTPQTRKVALRSAMTMTPDAGSIFATLATLARRGLGGRIGSGQQFISWIHEFDFCNAIDFLIARDDISGAVNLTSPNPLPQHEFMKVLRAQVHAPIGLPAPAWLVEIGTLLMRTESELVLKSRRVVPTRLIEAGFEFAFPTWAHACAELVSRPRLS